MPNPVNAHEPFHRASHTAHVLDKLHLYRDAAATGTEPITPLPSRRSNFRVSIRPGFICLIDTGRGASVSNKASSIIRWLRDKGYDLKANRVLCRDPKGKWDELVVANGCCIGFRFIREADLDAAIAKAIRIRATSR